jgi:hypothetical protein
MLQILIGVAILALLVGGFRFCYSVYESTRGGNSWDTDPRNPAWNPDHPHWNQYKKKPTV